MLTGDRVQGVRVCEDGERRYECVGCVCDEWDCNRGEAEGSTGAAGVEGLRGVAWQGWQKVLAGPG